MSDRRVDVLMATRDGERFVAEQIASVLGQTYPHLRLLVSDDGSRDHTLQIVERFAHMDARVRLVPCDQQLGSAPANFLWLLRHADADYVALCDQDDVWMRDKVALTLQRMRELEEHHGGDVPLLVFTDMQVVDENLAPIASSFERYAHIDASRTSFGQILAQAVGSGNTMLANRALVALAAQTPVGQPMIMHDWWLSLIAAGFGHMAHVPHATVLYRQHQANANGASQFSVVGWASRLDEMGQSVARGVRQAQSFQSVYGELLDEERRETLRRFAAIQTQSFPARVVTLCTTGTWKSGVRKVGQVVGLATWRA